MVTSPPGPDLPTMWQAAPFYNRPVFVLLKLRKRYGDCFRMREPAFYGREWWVWVCDPGAIQEVLAAGASLTRPGLQEGRLAAALGEETDGGARLARERVAERDPRCATAAAAIARRHVADWPRGRPYRIQVPLRKTVVESLCDGLAGIADPAVAMRVERALAAERRFDLSLYANLRYGDGGPRAARRLAREQETIAAELAAAHSDAPDAWRGTATVLADVAEVTTLLLAWAFEQLVRTEGALGALQDDLDGGSEDYLDAVVAATLWGRYPILSIGRRLLADHAVCGYELPAGTMLRLAVGIAHLPPSVGARPEMVRPELFLGEEARVAPELVLGHGTEPPLGELAVAVASAVLREVALAVDLARVIEPPELSRFQRPDYMVRPHSSTRVIVESRARRPARELVGAMA
jgi:cytochrome P450 family 135